MQQAKKKWQGWHGRVMAMVIAFFACFSGSGMQPALAQALTPFFYLSLDSKWYEVEVRDDAYMEYILAGSTLMFKGSRQANCRRTGGQAMVPSSRLLLYGTMFGMVYLDDAGQPYEWHQVGNLDVMILRATSSTGDVICDNALTSEPIPSDRADLAVSLTDTPDPVTPGSALSYTASVFNGGPNTAQSLTLTFVIPSQATYSSASGAGWSCSRAGVQVTCTRSSLASGATATATVHLVSPATAGVTLHASATVSSSTIDPNSANNTASQTTAVTGAPSTADLSITMQGSYDPVVVSTAFVYTIGVENLGPSTAANVQVVYTLPGPLTYIAAAGTGWTCSIATRTITCTRPSMTAGSSSAIQVSVTAPGTPTSITNTATVGSATTDPIQGNNSASTSTSVVYQTQSADVAVTGASPGSQQAGSTYSYTLGITNNGPMSTTDVVVALALPVGATFQGGTGAGWTCLPAQSGGVTCTRASLASGATAPLVIQVMAGPTAGQATFTANVRSARADANHQNNTYSVTHPITGGSGGIGDVLFRDGFEEYRVFKDGYESNITNATSPLNFQWKAFS